MTTWLRKKKVAERYGLDVRSIDRKSRDGMLPPPKYPIGRWPMWDLDELERHDRAAVAKPSKGKAKPTARTEASV
jgi:predicted site-specific integrase-resolvase